MKKVIIIIHNNDNKHTVMSQFMQYYQVILAYIPK